MPKKRLRSTPSPSRGLDSLPQLPPGGPLVAIGEAPAAGTRSRSGCRRRSRSSQRTLPPWRTAICLTSARPRPTPPACSAWPGQAKERLEDALAHRSRERPGRDRRPRPKRARCRGRGRGRGRSRPRRRHSAARSRAGCAAPAATAARRPAMNTLPAPRRRADARRLLGGDGEQVDLVVVQRVLGGVEPAREQHLLDQAVELGDVLVDLGLQRVALRRRRLGEHRHRHLHPRQRRAQLVAGVGEQRPMRLDERLDARRGDVEARRDRGDLVGARDVDAVAERAGAELLDALLERLEAPRQSPHDRIGARGDGEKENDEDDRQPGAARQAGQQQQPGRFGAGARRVRRRRGARTPPPALSRSRRAAAHLTQARTHRPKACGRHRA